MEVLVKTYWLFPPATPVQVLLGCPVTRTHNLLAHKTPPTKNNGQAGGKTIASPSNHKTTGTTSKVSKTNQNMWVDFEREGSSAGGRGNRNTYTVFHTFCCWHLLAGCPIVIWFTHKKIARCVPFLKPDFSAGMQWNFEFDVCLCPDP